MKSKEDRVIDALAHIIVFSVPSAIAAHLTDNWWVFFLVYSFIIVLRIPKNET